MSRTDKHQALQPPQLPPAAGALPRGLPDPQREQPTARRGFPGPLFRGWRLDAHRPPRTVRRTRMLGVLAVVTALVVCGAALSLRLSRADGGSSAAAAAGDSATEAREVMQDELERRIDSALRAEQFPVFLPGLERLGTAEWAAAVNRDGCADIGASNAVRCRSGAGDGAQTVAVVGDSSAIGWMAGINQAARSLGYETVPLTRSQCPAARVAVTHDGGRPFTECASHRNWAVAQILRIRPDVLIVADSDDVLDRLESGSSGADAVQEVSAGLAATLDRVAPAVRDEILVLSPPPAGRSLQDCVRGSASPEGCSSTVGPAWENLQRAQLDALSVMGSGGAWVDVGNPEAQTRYVDTQRWFCDRDGRCPGFVGVTPVRADSRHLTPEYSRSLAPLLVDVLGGAGT